MSNTIYGNVVGGSTLPKSYVLETEDGVTLTGVLVDDITVFDATDNDVREGKTYASDNGVSIGTKEIPSYYVNEGVRVIPNNSQYVLPVPEWNYTKLQAIICPFNTNLQDSVSAERVAINDNVYAAMSTEILSSVVKDDEKSRVDFGITNTSGKTCLIRYFMYKEIY